ncbi:MAG: thioredoxin family protein [Cyclobacteriaceae bacterium]
MKKLQVIAVIILFVFLRAFSPSEKSSSETSGIVFHEGKWEEVLDLAKRENKYIFLDIYASWCGPCRVMKLKTFTDELTR